MLKGLKVTTIGNVCGLCILLIVFQGLFFREILQTKKHQGKTTPKTYAALKQHRTVTVNERDELKRKHRNIQFNQDTPSLAQKITTRQHVTDDARQILVEQEVKSRKQIRNNEDSKPNLEPNNHTSSQEPSAGLVEFLTEELKNKLKEVTKSQNITLVNCTDVNIKYEEPPCGPETNNSCLRLEVPENLRERVESLVLRENLQVPQKYWNVLEDMRSALPGHYDVIIVNAMSSNHYREGQGMLQNLHEKVFPLLKNFTFVIYDLGLTDEERTELQKYCRCTVLRFPFERFPPHHTTLKCFGWKPTVIRAHYDNANFIIWTDTSIRITNPDAIPKMIERARTRGLQQRHNSLKARNPFHTLVQMYTFFGDSPCAFMPYTEAETGYGIYHREAFVRKAILDPWYACAVNPDCICPVEQKTVQQCGPPRRIAGCMRNEQSAITIILAKLFREKYRQFAVDVGSFQAVRREGSNYFEELKANGTKQN